MHLRSVHNTCVCLFNTSSCSLTTSAAILDAKRRTSISETHIHAWEHIVAASRSEKCKSEYREADREQLRDKMQTWTYPVYTNVVHRTWENSCLTSFHRDVDRRWLKCRQVVRCYTQNINRPAQLSIACKFLSKCHPLSCPETYRKEILLITEKLDLKRHQVVASCEDESAASVFK